MIDQKLLTFLKLYQTMNYHETAKLLNLTQPAITQHIQALEREYKCRLFVYNRKKLSRTFQADVLSTYASAAVFNERKLREKMEQKQETVYRIGATKTVGEYMIGGMLAEFLLRPQTRCEVAVDNTAHLLQMLDRTQIDFAVVEGKFDKSRYGYRLFRNEPMTGICAPNHPFAGRELALEDLFSQTIIVREFGSGTRNIFCNILQEHGFSEEDFQRTVTVSEFSLICSLVKAGVGISFVYRAVAEGNPELARFSVRNISSVHEMNFVYLKDTAVAEMIQDFYGFHIADAGKSF